MICKFCENNKLAHVYTPKHSKVDLAVYVCLSCGLVQTTYDRHKYELQNDTQPISNKALNKISCDADYSEIRVGKQQMAEKPFGILQKHCNLSNIKKILDMRSARGDFARNALSFFHLNEINCIESDEYMISSYQEDPRFQIHKNKYYLLDSALKFDLIYSCHSLEHYREPNKYINFVHSRLFDGGYFYLDVPNIDSIASHENFDEFFYDKHLFYFSGVHLKSWLEMRGFEILDMNTKGTCIEILSKKICSPASHMYRAIPNEAARIKSLIYKYKENLDKNRSLAPEIVNNINKWIDDENSAVACFGCGRLLDTLISYGNLDLDKFSLLIDNFLVTATNKLYNRDIHDDKILANSNITKIIIFTRSPSVQLDNYLRTLQPFLNIRHVSTFFEEPATKE